MAYVVNGVCRYTINGSMNGRAVANVLDVFIDTTGTVTARPTAVQAFAGIVLDAWHNRILPTICAVYTAQSVTWVDLDSATGTVGSRASTPTHTWPFAGTNAIAAQAGNACALMHKNLSSTRGSRKGRMYLPGLAESYTDPAAPNVLTTSAISAYTTALNSFYNDVHLTAGGPFAYDTHPVVSHVLTREPIDPAHPDRVPAPLTGVGITVTSFTIDPVLATQRRRLRR
jgi:hypothetical protein